MTPEQLGFRKYASNTSTSRHLTQPSLVLSPEIANASTAPALIRVGVSALTLAQHLYGYTIDELLLHSEQELRRLDAMAQQQPVQKRTRREALEFLISLPLALMGLNVVEDGNASLHIEEVLPSYVTAIPACWRL